MEFNENATGNDIQPSSLPAAPEEAAPAAASLPETESHESPEASEAPESMENAELDLPKVKKGEIVTGTIISATPTEITVDLGLKAPGIISGRDLERMDKSSLETMKPGEPITAYVMTPENKEGNVVLSLSRALEEQDWRTAEELRKSGEVYIGRIDGFNKGGLIVRFGRVRGFVPESQASRDRRMRAQGQDPQEKWGSMRNEEITVKVVEVDRTRNRLILSERDAAPQMREQRKSQLLGELQVGDERTGRVKSVADFGAFVDIGGADGLVHLTEITWKHINHPKEALKVGQEVNVKVIGIDTERKRIGLSIKALEEDPWVVIARTYQPDQLVQGTITKLTKFGAFARLVENPEIEGLIHISELASQRVNNPKDVVQEGDVLTLRVVKVDADERRLGLSLKRVTDSSYAERDYRRATNAPDVNSELDYDGSAFKESPGRRDRKRTKKGGKRGKDDYEDDFGSY
jgi:small subunit ribosomal protein S1